LKLAPALTSLVAAGLVPILASCGSTPEQKYLKVGSVAKIHNVVVFASSKNLKLVREKRVEGLDSLAIFGLPGVGAALAELAVAWNVTAASDTQHSATLQAGTRKETIAQRLSGHFTKALSAGKVFDSIEETAQPEGTLLPKDLSNFDALLRLKVTEVSLRPVTPNEMSLFVEVSAEMVALRRGSEGPLLWSRVERSVNNESHTVEFYKSNGVPALDECLKKLARRLAADIAYSR
jgi:hypothetical protein